MILRLLLFEECHRRCPGCCNKQFDLTNLPVVSRLDCWEQVLLTGGEPMLHPDIVIEAAKQVPRGIPVYVYTAKLDNLLAIGRVMQFVDGFTVTLHDQIDVSDFITFSTMLRNVWKYRRDRLSMRLNIFKGVQIRGFDIDLTGWKVKENVEWIENCPLPENEVFMRYSHAG